MFKKYYVVFLMLLVPIISVSIISNIFDNINNKSVVSEPVKKEIKIEKKVMKRVINLKMKNIRE